ncbi:sensor histidine kinase [Marinicella rhabdoformis]|uniref:sensor histidine kinase n=1 Tax=Marinicella rhabdoformis TaxID=2580566 RepID=UPI0012AEBF60|nr:HAMP domain-containing sensor histidine kinase [Marinicella rhabdoformis]
MGKKIKNKDINSRLIKVLMFQLLFISLATIAGVFGAAKVVENVLIREALEGEAKFFWEAYSKDTEFPLPKTMNLTGYFADQKAAGFPVELNNMTENFQRVALNEKLPIVYKTEKMGRTLYLVFEEAQVGRLALFFGIAPLVFVLLLIYVPAFFSFILSKRAISPLVQMVKKIESIDISKASLSELHFEGLTGDAEVLSLVKSFEDFSAKIASMIERERNFSRYASHELRTPLTVLKVSLASLKKRSLDEKGLKIVNRMEPVIDEMSELLEALLVLSREQNLVVSEYPMLINDTLKQLVSQNILAFESKDLKIEWQLNQLLESRIPEQAFNIVISNLLRNAFAYSHTGGVITVAIKDKSISIKDNGVGMNAEQLEKITQPFYRVDEFSEHRGVGLGLSIVDWLCKQCDWLLDFKSEPGVGTEVILTMNNIKILASKNEK